MEKMLKKKKEVKFVNYNKCSIIIIIIIIGESECGLYGNSPSQFSYIYNYSKI